VEILQIESIDGKQFGAERRLRLSCVVDPIFFKRYRVVFPMVRRQAPGWFGLSADLGSRYNRRCRRGSALQLVSNSNPLFSWKAPARLGSPKFISNHPIFSIDDADLTDTVAHRVAEDAQDIVVEVPKGCGREIPWVIRGFASLVSSSANFGVSDFR
jgi:hypothetical protein